MNAGGERLRVSHQLVVVERPDASAVYHNVLGGLCFVDRPTLDLLRAFESPMSRQQVPADCGITAAQIDAFIEFFATRGLLVPADRPEPEILDERRRQRARDLAIGRQVRIVQLVVANRCNFRCHYCFEGLGGTPLAETMYAHSSRERLEAQESPANSFMRPEAAERYLGAAIEMATAAGTPALAVQFFGGEPMICWNTIRHVLDVFGRGERHGLELSYSIVTNGSLMTDEAARAFKAFDVPIIVSYDSPTSEARPMAGGRNSHEVIARTLDLLHLNGNRVVLNSVLGAATFDAFDHGIVDYAFAHGIYEIGVVLDFDPAFYRSRPADEIVDKLWDVWSYAAGKGVVVTGYWHQILQGLAGHDRYGRIGFQNCSAMGVQFSIEPSGAVFSCKASGGYFGNIIEVDRILRAETYRKYAMRGCTPPEACRGCPVEHFCGGLCLGAVENRHNLNIQAIEESACEVYRRLTDRFLRQVEPDSAPRFSLAPARPRRAPDHGPNGSTH